MAESSNTLLFLLLTVFFSKLAFSTIIGEPRIKCSQNGIMVMMEHDKPFKGALYLRGSAEKKSCKADFAKAPTSNISFEFQFDDCPSRRKRQIVQPRGMTMSSTLVISYHGTIITHKDIAYQIDCFYREEHSQVQALLNVTAPKPQVLSDQPQLPVCDYKVELAEGSPKGAVTSSLAGNSQVVTVGQSVIHVWTCSKEAPNDVYCMQVHSCMADDGDNDKVEVVDMNGCTNDGELLSPIRYNGGSMRAAASSQAFKFADKHIVYFKCSIRLTIKDPAENCPINNCARNGTVSRQTRSLRNPFIVFNRRRPDDIEINLLVTSPELIVEPQTTHNHLMSTYKPNYSYRRSEYVLSNGNSLSLSLVFIVFLCFLSL